MFSSPTCLRHLGALLLLAASATQAVASPDLKAAQERYDADRSLCNEESTAAARLQCRRDARAEYDKAVAAAKAQRATPAAPATPTATTASSPARARASEPVCNDCAQVIAVSVTQKAGEYSAAGVLAGGAIGAVLGNQVGGGLGKDLATIAGAAGGAYAGKVIEEKLKTHMIWNVTVQYGNGGKANFEFTADPGLQVGDKVRNTGNTIVKQ